MSDDESRYTGTPRCRICGTDENITRHHLVPRKFIDGHTSTAKSRRIKAEQVGHRCNIVRLCRAHHVAVERGRLRAELRAVLTPNEVRHVEKTAGRYWLDEQYPRSVAEATHA